MSDMHDSRHPSRAALARELLIARVALHESRARLAGIREQIEHLPALTVPGLPDDVADSRLVSLDHVRAVVDDAEVSAVLGETPTVPDGTSRSGDDDRGAAVAGPPPARLRDRRKADGDPAAERGLDPVEVVSGTRHVGDPVHRQVQP